MFFILNDLTPIRPKGKQRGVYAGRDTIVAPITMIVPGVLSGSAGPILYPPQVVANTASRWDGIPILVNHPMKDGKPVTTDQAVIEAFGIGSVRNPLIVNGILEALGWFDVLNMLRVDKRIFDALVAGQPLELSVGIQGQHYFSEGVHNGRQYQSILADLKPDHLAILPDMEGACSLKDGCGVHGTPTPSSSLQELAMANCNCNNKPLTFQPMFAEAPVCNVLKPATQQVNNAQSLTDEQIQNAKKEGKTYDPLLGRAVPELNWKRRMGYE